MKVTKRDGRIVNFDKTKIVEAIKKAMERTTGGVNLTIANKIADSIEKTNKDLSVEEIQDLVENKLMTTSRKDVAKEYITYRNERTRIREQDKAIYKDADKILNCENITNDNANIDQYSFSGKEERIAEMIHKSYAIDKLFTDRVRKAYNEHWIYIHDLNKYAIGEANCLFADVAKLLKNGFSTRNGDVRGANSVSTAFQLVAVIFQCQSQVQFGGVASAHIDTDIAPYVKISFKKHFKDALKYIGKFDNPDINEIINENKIEIDNNDLKIHYPNSYQYAYDMLNKEGKQGAQALYHNLNTLESRAGSQVPFTSINFGCDTTPEGRLVSKWILEASIDGIGKFHRTSIFPISIFQYKKGINDKPGTPNYDLKLLAIKSMSKRIYPNWVNCDFTQHHEDPNDPDTRKATMGCRTQLGYDRFGMGYKQVGRGNICPTTMILPKLGIEYGICLGKRKEPDLDGFWKAFDKLLDVTRESLLNRFTYIVKQSPKSAPFMYNNGTMADTGKCKDNVYNAVKHGTLAIGFIGLSEMCQALFGKNFVHDKKVYNFALSVIKHIYDFAKESSEKYNLNFSTYATPAEGSCETIATNLRKEYGSIPFVTDKKYTTNSSHVPVWEKVSMNEKLNLEAPFTFYETGGCITYLEIDSGLENNPKGVEKLIDYAMSLNIPYLAINFPIDTCNNCGFQGNIPEKCPRCNSENIERLRRVTGYLSTDVSHFNKGKQQEVDDRVKHNKTVDFGGENT
ncbi:Ribonucleotide reductase of class III (anaerobic), large subunit [Ruminococcaceae bacterium BL-6]|nr:Ribonucleotide reductase of class III (anaerobic), large subunit [Ruminococcaceae bacterium BL-6]